MKVVWLCQYSLQYVSSKLKINIDPSQIHPATWLHYLAKEIRNHPNIDLHIITPSYYLDKDYEFTEGNVTYHLLKIWYPHLGRKFNYLYSRMTLGFNYPLLKRKFLKIINEIGPDIINLHGTEHFYGIYLNEIKYPVLVWMQGIINHVIKYENSFQFRNKLENENRVLRHQKYYITIPSNMEELILKRNSRAKFFHLYYPISGNAFELQSENVQKENDIVYVGSICKRKGIEDLLEATYKIVEKIPQLKVKVIGHSDANYLANIKKIISDSKIRNNVNIRGAIPDHDEVLLEVKKSKIFILPTYVDSGPRSVAESMAIGTPVISYDLDGLPLMIKNGVSGILIEKGNINQLSEAAISLLQDDAKREDISKIAHEYARNNFYAPRIVQELINIYKIIIANSEKDMNKT